ncbi:MAG: PUA domain-containing protein [Thermofilaceae archaeon]
MDKARLASPSDLELRELKALLAYQFGKGAENLLNGVVEVRRSPLTGRIREVYVNGELIGTIRASDGFFVPSLRGAEKLLAILPFPKSRVVVQKDLAKFVAEGRSVFCKHVVAADTELKPGDETLVVDDEGHLVAIGKAVVSGSTILTKKTGVAVKVRKGVKNEG